MKARTNHIERWYGCYNSPRGELFTPESNRHPAKMAVGLCERILAHGCDRGYWKPGDVILDPMAGIFTTGIVGATMGYKIVGVELEKHFQKLAWTNIEHAEAAGVPTGRMTLLGGDARDLSLFLNHPRVREYLDAALCSPPYADQQVSGESNLFSHRTGTKAAEHACDGYSGAISSPPYGDLSTIQGAGVTHRILKVARGQGMAAAVKLYRETVVDRLKAHGRWSDANIQRHIEMALATAENGGYAGVVTSPAYAETHVGNPGEQVLAAQGRAREIGTKATGHGGKGRHGFQYSHDIERILAMLVGPESEQSDIFGGKKRIRTERKSFFKRLHEKKFPHLAVNHEDVLFFRRRA